MKHDQHIRKERLHRLLHAWRRLHGWQKLTIVLPLRFSHIVTTIADWLPQTISAHITRRRARFAYLYPAHWLSLP